MKKNGDIAVIICNWNKKDYVIKCIEAVQKSTIKDIDIIVVDNASTDDSVVSIREQFGESITLIENPVNKGGSGGFNRGIQYALQSDYKYIHLLDNDAFVDGKAIESLFIYLEENKEVGAVGSTIYVLDEPNCVQEMGAKINYETFQISLNFPGVIDDAELPETILCDYVPACSMMIRSEVLRDVGGMDESYFIYWDDIDLGQRIRQAGYQIAAIKESKAWHKRGSTVRVNTFGTYYSWRNRIHYFLKYLEDEQLTSFIKVITNEFLRAVFMGNITHQYNGARSIYLALEDALNGVRFVAPNGRILVREEQVNPLPLSLEDIGGLQIIEKGDIQVLNNTLSKISEFLPLELIRIIPFAHSKEELEKIFSKQTVQSSVDENYPVCIVCNHILDICDEINEDILFYIDSFNHIIYSMEERKFVEFFNTFKLLFENIQFPVIEQRIYDFRNKISLEE